ncbi:MAG: CPBP family intramembrane metalloprotease [Proteobacteria bacterium]|jgi:membrane protease YdiL (CAAX protease family)|nr:CPBP family intramembrane metalloprotease [Desulfocapsa sp.]MBU3945413.1 CPBP family intramembrane metalloprotease [Pseudomonadota bacterium]MCG2742885.1 CPBP family intramembrane metalloprotease [Desulfobacteraceae bacterium]MBU3983748.1 CPBP family intramembrane metalloprotease [Pseudomonadota bacterium]MBU4043589.1 CPBP family intramembrane metalloprotease [Pseudomonadota bacterium]
MYSSRVAVIQAPNQISRTLLATEFICIFFVLPILFTINLRGTHPFPFILASGFFAAFYLLNDKGFSRASFGDLFSLRDHGKRIIITFFSLALLLTLLTVVLVKPEYLFNYPRHKTTLWLTIMIFYPLLAVYPQELFYRAFLFRRYRSLFPGEQSMVFVSALTFGFAHIIYGNIPAVLLTLIGGYLFGLTYKRSKSILVVSLEHALYGCLLYTIGLGQFIHTSVTHM